MPPEDVTNPNSDSQASESVEQQITDATGGDTVDNSQPETPSVSPAWQPILDTVPEEFHSRIIPTLSDWDKNFGQVQEKYSRYKDFDEHGVKRDEIEEAMNLRYMLQTRPRDVWEYLNTQGNYSQGQIEQNVPVEDDEVVDLENPQGFDITKHPRFVELENQLAQFTQVAQQTVQQQQAEAMDREIEQSFKTLTETYGTLEVEDQQIIGQLAIANGGDIIKAGQTYFGRINAVAPRQPANASAPPVLGGQRGLPIKQVNFAEMDPETRTREVAKLLSQQQ